VATTEARPTRDGKTKHRVRVRLKGFPEISKTYETEAEARQFADGIEFAIRNGLYKPPSQAITRTVSELFERYRETVLPRKPASERKQRAQLALVERMLGDIPLAEVTAARIASLRAELLAGETQYGTPRSGSTANRYLALLSHVLSFAERELGWIETNPMRRVRKLKEPRGRVRRLTKPEVKDLLAACRASRNPNLHLAVLLAVSTGMRRGEILGLRREHVDRERKRVVLERTKNGDRRAVPLSGPAFDALKEKLSTPGQPQDLIFPGRVPDKPVDIHTAWTRVVKTVGLKDFRFHDLRHAAASFLLEASASLPQLSEILGHKSVQMIKRYGHLSESASAQVAPSCGPCRESRGPIAAPAQVPTYQMPLHGLIIGPLLSRRAGRGTVPAHARRRICRWVERVPRVLQGLRQGVPRGSLCLLVLAVMFHDALGVLGLSVLQPKGNAGRPVLVN